jgi:hypothetical protein
MSDRLDAIEAGLRDGRYDCRVPGDTDDVRWLVGEVRRLRETHAAAVEAAWREGALMILDCPFTSEDLDRMWRQSEARRGLAEKGMP